MRAVRSPSLSSHASQTEPKVRLALAASQFVASEDTPGIRRLVIAESYWLDDMQRSPGGSIEGDQPTKPG